MHKTMKRRHAGRLRKLTAEQRTWRQQRRERNGKLTGAAKVAARTAPAPERRPRRKLAPDWFAKAAA